MPKKFKVEVEWSGYSRGVSVYEIEAASAGEARELYYEGRRVSHCTMRDDTEKEIVEVKEI